MSLSSIASLLKHKNSPLIRGVKAAMVVEAANQFLVSLISEAILEQAKATFLKNKVLTITCLSSIAAQEVKLNEAELIKRLQDAFGAETIEKIVYSL